MLQKQSVNINFAEGLDTKTDPKQVGLGKFLALKNTIFTKGGLLQKRNGYQNLASIPGSNYLTTLNGNLTSIGNSISAYSSGSSTSVSRGSIQPMEVSTLSLIRNSLNQTQCDSAVAPNGLVCTVYSELNSSSTDYRYVVADSTTGQNIVAPSPIPVASGTVTGSPRVFVLGFYFVIVFTNVISGTSHLQYVAISTVNPATVTANADISNIYTPASTVSWDGVVSNGSLYIAYNTTSGGQSIKVTFLTERLSLATPVTFSGRIATMMSLCVDETVSNPVVYVSMYDSASSTGYTLGVFYNLATALTAQEIISSGAILNIASAAQNGMVTIFSEVSNNYGYDSGIPTHYLGGVTVTQSGTVGTPYVVLRSVGIASKAFIISGVIYFLSAYQSSFQPTYFLVNGSTSTEAAPVIAGKLAYENGGGYLTHGLPSVTVTGTVAQIAYLYKDLIEALSTLNNSQQTTAGGIYSQTGINLSSFNIQNTTGIVSAEIGSDLHISGGFLWMYDGYLPVEHNFFLWPDSIEVSTATSGGFLTAQQYFYQAVYEWSDNQGNIYRSAPSIPVTVTTTGTTSANTVNIPYLRLTYKTANPVKIVIYRWSAANQIYYQVTSITAPTLNSTTSDAVAFVDTLADSSIIGNNIIYTNGGVVEDVNAPATNIMTLFDTRLWLVEAEDPNLLWFSKQVIESTPVEMSDLLTFYVAPTTGAQGSTGPITALSVMDDKLIIFKQNAIYYINGTGPDNTGSNNQYSQPIFVTSTVGCAVPNSIVFMPNGLMFQSDKGIWLLGRDLSTQYIGAPVEEFNESLVQSAVNVPQTNQVRFTLNTGETLMYDYYYGQWGTFVGVPAISSCVFQGLHTFINSSGAIYQENPGVYLDGSNPVLISFLTSWLNLAGIQGYQRAFFFFILGQYLTPHKLQVTIAYDYNSSPEQATLITPDNFSPDYGGISPYGQGTYGGPGDLEQWRVFLAKQRCQAFQIGIEEVYDPSFGIPAGEGLTMSGLNLVYAIKKGWRTISSATSAG